MKEKIKKILFVIAEVGTVTWAIVGMGTVVATLTNILQAFTTGQIGKLPATQQAIFRLSETAGFSYLIIKLLFYFLSAALILYLLRKYERKN
ncbi:MAG: hypothetical protein NT012_00305 [Candidatus Nealsonbacteria bacterium]|nr:hypothetical protein [Candidatus Nealsonbacteria bacterium]